MIRPHHFTPNPETQRDNAFQQCAENTQSEIIAKKAYQEFSDVARALRERGILVYIYEDESTATPDSVFPNNWFSTHPGGKVAVYPMFANNRRKERRYDILEMLKSEYRVQDVVDYSGMELDGLYLEGTGAMVFDHVERLAYAVASNRANPILLERFCAHFNYEPMMFNAFDSIGTPVYHTNVLMCIATDFVLIGLDMIPDSERRTEIERRLLESGRTIIALTNQQILEFAGNACELAGDNGNVLALSQRAYTSLTSEQIGMIERSADLLPLNAETIELAGGSIRCMLAGVHLSRR